MEEMIMTNEEIVSLENATPLEVAKAIDGYVLDRGIQSERSV